MTCDCSSTGKGALVSQPVNVKNINREKVITATLELQVSIMSEFSYFWLFISAAFFADFYIDLFTIAEKKYLFWRIRKFNLLLVSYIVRYCF